MNHADTPRNTLRIVPFLLCTWLALAADAMAADVIRTEPLADRWFTTEIEAVEAMRAHCLRESTQEDAEHMGAVLQTREGRYMITHGQADPGQTKVTFAVTRPSSMRVVALWHTHGAPDRNAERFSIQDNDTVRETGRPFYLIAPSGQISLLVSASAGLSEHLQQARDAHRLKSFRDYRGLALYRLTDVTGSS